MNQRMQAPPGRGLLIAAGLALGLGLGGFVDGILLHQVLQWHHMVSSAGYPPTTVANLEVNTFWDGIFHVATWLFTLAGALLLFRASQRPRAAGSTRAFAGSLLAGWGVFNLVEGVVDHHLLGLHHVREDLPDQLAWDLGFLALGALLALAGWGLIRSGQRAAPPDETGRVS